MGLERMQRYSLTQLHYSFDRGRLCRLTFEFSSGYVSPPVGTYLFKANRSLSVPQKAVSKIVFGLIREYNKFWIEEISFMDGRNKKLKSIIDTNGCSISISGENEEKQISFKPNEKIVSANVHTSEKSPVNI